MARFVVFETAVCMSYLLSTIKAKPVADPDPLKYMLLPIEEEDSSLAPMFRSAEPNPEPQIEEAAAVMATVPWAKVVLPVTAVGAVGGGLYYVAPYVAPKIKSYFSQKNNVVKEKDPTANKEVEKQQREQSKQEKEDAVEK